MESRQKYLSELGEYINKIDDDVTMILQNFLWDRDSLLECKERVICKYDSNHIIPIDKKKGHEDKCYIKCQGYTKEDHLLPEPLNPEAHTVVKLTSDNIKEIIENAAKSDPLFKREGERKESVVSEPLSLERLQATYTPDERRAIHDAVVNTVPSFHDLSDLALPSEKTEGQNKKSRLQVLAELRDMKRRRTRYRVAVPTKNYSHVLKDVIATQMELYTAAQNNIKAEPSYTTTHYKDDHHFSARNSEKQTKTNEEERYLRKPYNERVRSYTKERDRRYIQHDDRKRHNSSVGNERYGYNSSSSNAAQINIKTEPIDNNFSTKHDKYGYSTTKRDNYKKRNTFNYKDEYDSRHHRKSYSERDSKSYISERDKRNNKHEDRRKHSYERSDKGRYNSSN